MASLALLGAAAPTLANDFIVKDIQAYLFFSNSGALSENIIGSKKILFNTAIGEGQAGGPASNVLIDLVLAAEDLRPPTKSATLKVTYKVQGRDTTLTRNYTSRFFEPNQVVHESVLLEDATCGLVTIEAHAGASSTKKVTIPFSCGE
jgi:hypothetical protein